MDGRSGLCRGGADGGATGAASVVFATAGADVLATPDVPTTFATPAADSAFAAGRLATTATAIAVSAPSDASATRQTRGDPVARGDGSFWASGCIGGYDWSELREIVARRLIAVETDFARVRLDEPPSEGARWNCADIVSFDCCKDARLHAGGVRHRINGEASRLP